MSASLEQISGDEKIIDWRDEATAIVNDVKRHVDEIVISGLPSDARNIYLNLRTIEGATCCVHVSSMGFRIVSDKYDTIDANKAKFREEEDIYETLYALLDHLSPRYVESFGNQLCQQLRQLEATRTEFNEEDEEEEEDEDDNSISDQH